MSNFSVVADEGYPDTPEGLERFMDCAAGWGEAVVVDWVSSSSISHADVMYHPAEGELEKLHVKVDDVPSALNLGLDMEERWEGMYEASGRIGSAWMDVVYDGTQALANLDGVPAGFGFNVAKDLRSADIQVTQGAGSLEYAVHHWTQIGS